MSFKVRMDPRESAMEQGGNRRDYGRSFRFFSSSFRQDSQQKSIEGKTKSMGMSSGRMGIISGNMVVSSGKIGMNFGNSFVDDAFVIEEGDESDASESSVTEMPNTIMEEDNKEDSDKKEDEPEIELGQETTTEDHGINNTSHPSINDGDTEDEIVEPSNESRELKDVDPEQPTVPAHDSLREKDVDPEQLTVPVHDFLKEVNRGDKSGSNDQTASKKVVLPTEPLIAIFSEESARQAPDNDILDRLYYFLVINAFTSFDMALAVFLFPFLSIAIGDHGFLASGVIFGYQIGRAISQSI